jgi:cyclopropane-fatty-acyl-phospholipid synthase
MRHSVAPQDISPYLLFGRGIIDRIAKRILCKLLEDIRHGSITLSDQNQEISFGTVSETCRLSAVLIVTDKRFFRSIVFGGSIGAAKAYMAGYWRSDDLTSLIRIIILNQDVLLRMENGFSSLMNFVHNAIHRKRRNSPDGSPQNIYAHYDIGNDFFRTFLDDTMTYSCGIFKNEHDTLDSASIAKYDHICRKLSLTPADHIIEIGSGWGGFAIHAAGNYGCRVTTTTISKAQYDLAQKRIEQAGLRDRITLLMRDYREIEGRFSKLVSIEMIEAVGHEFLETFFSCCGRLLIDDGVMALQSITINDRMYDQHIKTVDFIRRYIFPGGSIPSVTSLCNAATAASDLRLVHHEDITPHYQKTLIAWRQKFKSHLDEIRTLGYNEQFIRMWEYYFCYCEAGFAERYIGDVQMLFSKPGWRGATIFTMSHE